MTDIHLVLAAAVLTWIQIMVAAELHTPTWTRAGARLAFGNREHLPPRSEVAARADRAAKNMLENMVVFVAVLVAADRAGSDATTGAAVFVVSRVVYAATYVAGVLYVRSLAWAVALGGVGWIALGALGVVGR